MAVPCRADAHQDQSYIKRGLNQNSSSDEFHNMNSLRLLIQNMLCSKLHCQKILISFPFHTKSALPPSPARRNLSLGSGSRLPRKPHSRKRRRAVGKLLPPLLIETVHVFAEAPLYRWVQGKFGVLFVFERWTRSAPGGLQKPRNRPAVVLQRSVSRCSRVQVYRFRKNFPWKRLASGDGEIGSNLKDAYRDFSRGRTGRAPKGLLGF